MQQHNSCRVFSKLPGCLPSQHAAQGRSPSQPNHQKVADQVTPELFQLQSAHMQHQKQAAKLQCLQCLSALGCIMPTGLDPARGKFSAQHGPQPPHNARRRGRLWPSQPTRGPPKPPTAARKSTLTLHCCTGALWRLGTKHKAPRTREMHTYLLPRQGFSSSVNCLNTHCGLSCDCQDLVCGQGAALDGALFMQSRLPWLLHQGSIKDCYVGRVPHLTWHGGMQGRLPWLLHQGSAAGWGDWGAALPPMHLSTHFAACEGVDFQRNSILSEVRRVYFHCIGVHLHICAHLVSHAHTHALAQHRHS